MSDFTIEPAPLRPTFAAFCDSYVNGQYAPKWRRLLECLSTFNGERLAFECRVLVPNQNGFYGGPDSVGRQWCFPWQWYRRYYDTMYARRK